MFLNAKKCNIMQVTPSPKPISFDYSIHNTLLESVSSTQNRIYLGIQSNFQWEASYRKATNTLNVLKQNLILPMRSAKGIQVTCVPPGQICCLCRSLRLARDKVQIKRVQHRAAHYVHNTYSRYSSISTMLQSLN